MSKLGYISNIVGKQLNLAVANTYSQNVLDGSNLPSNSIIISSPIDSNGNDIGTYSMLATDNEGNPIRLTYSISEGNGLYYSSFSDSLKLNIDNNTIKINSTYNLYSTLKNVIDENTLISNSNETISVDVNNIGIASTEKFGISKIDGETINSDNGNIFVNTSKLEYSNSLSESFGIGVGDGVGLISTNGLLEINESSLEKGTRERSGVVKPDGKTISSNDGILSANTIAFAKAIKDRFGISKVDNIKLRFNKDNKVSVNTNSIQSASDKNYGVSKIDTNTLDIDDNNVLSANKYMTIREYIDKYYDLSEEYRNKLSLIREEIKQNPKFLKKDEILLFSINETSVTSLDKPKYQEPVISMPDQYVNVDLNIITTCDFTLSVLFDDSTNESPSVSLINVNYNDEDVFENNNIDPNKIYSSTNGELKKITLKFWAKNFSNSKKPDTISTGIFITVSNSNNTEKSITEKYAIIRYNSLYEKYQEDEEIIVDTGRWQLVASSVQWREISENNEFEWQSANIIIPNRFRRVEIKYQVQNLDTKETTDVSVTFEIIRGNALKSSKGKPNPSKYKLYNYETHSPYSIGDFNPSYSSEDELSNDDINKMYPEYNDIADIITHATGEGHFISIQIRLKQQVFPSELIFNPGIIGDSDYNLYTYLVKDLNLMFRIKEEGVSSDYHTMLGVGSWDENPDPLLYWVYFDNEQLIDSSKIFYNTSGGAKINSVFEQNTNKLKLYSTIGYKNESGHTLRFIPINDITRAYYETENFTSYFENIIDLFSVVIKNVKPHNEEFNIQMIGKYDELTYSKKLDAIPLRFQYNYYTYYSDVEAPSNVECTYVIFNEYGKNVSSVPDISFDTMSYTITNSAINSASILKMDEGKEINLWYAYLSSATYLTNEFYNTYGSVSSDTDNIWNVPIKESIDYDSNDSSNFRNLPERGSSDFTYTATEYLRIVSMPAITIAGLNYDSTSRQGSNIFITYPNDAVITLENTYQLVKESDGVTELTVNNLLLITIAQENIKDDIKPIIEKKSNSGSNMFNMKISHANFNIFNDNIVTYYQVNTNPQSYFKSSNDDSKSVTFNPGDKVETWSINTYVGKTYKEYAYFFDKYYDSLPEDKLTYLVENGTGNEIYFFNSGVVTYLYNPGTISGMTYYTFYKGHNHKTNYTSYTLSSTISNTSMFNTISYTSSRNEVKSVLKYIIENSSTLVLNDHITDYPNYIGFTYAITIDNNTAPFINLYQGYLISSGNINNISDYSSNNIYFDGDILYMDKVFSLQYENAFRIELESAMEDDLDDPIPDSNPQAYNQKRTYSDEQINNIIIGVKNDLTNLKNNYYKPKLIQLVKNHTGNYTVHSNNSDIQITGEIYFSIPSDLNTSGYTIRHYNGFDLFIWNLFTIFDPTYYNIQFYEYDSNGQNPISRGYHGVEVIRYGYKYNIGIFVLNQTFSQEPDYWLFNNPISFDVYSLDYYTNHKLDYTMSSNNNDTTPIRFLITLYNSSSNDQISDNNGNTYSINYTYSISNGFNISSYSPTFETNKMVFSIPYSDTVNNKFLIQRSLTISQDETVYGPVQYIYLPSNEFMTTRTFFTLIQPNNDRQKLFDIPDDAPGMWHITNSELFILRSAPGDTITNERSSFQNKTAMFSYIDSIQKGERYERYDIDYWDNENSESRIKSIFGLCKVHESFWECIPNISIGGGNKNYNFIIPNLYNIESDN